MMRRGRSREPRPLTHSEERAEATAAISEGVEQAGTLQGPADSCTSANPCSGNFPTVVQAESSFRTPPPMQQFPDTANDTIRQPFAAESCSDDADPGTVLPFNDGNTTELETDWATSVIAPDASRTGMEEVKDSSHLCDGNAVFDMLDTARNDALNRADARSWFRSLGWCLGAAALDEVLDRRPRGEEPFRDCTGEEWWTLAELLTLAEDHMELCGPDPAAVRRSIRLFSGRGRPGHRWTTKEQLRFQAAALGEGHDLLGEQQVLDLLGLCGVPLTAKAVDLDAVAEALVDTICNPKVAGKQTLASPHQLASHLATHRQLVSRHPASDAAQHPRYASGSSGVQVENGYQHPELNTASAADSGSNAVARSAILGRGASGRNLANVHARQGLPRVGGPRAICR